MDTKKHFWIRLSLVNLAIVALLGTLLRSKMLFSMPWMDQKNMLNTHSHFAFGGWVTLGLFTLFIYRLLPPERYKRPVYQYLLWGVQVSSVGMLASFPFQGYGPVSIVFSTGLIVATYAFCWVFIKDLFSITLDASVRLLAIGALVCLVLSSLGPFTLAYILASRSGNDILYRDAIYFYLHFQYNGFFALAVFALFFHHLLQKDKAVSSIVLKRFSYALAGSVLPTLFLSFLWHPHPTYFTVLAYAGCLLILWSLYYLLNISPFRSGGATYQYTGAKVFWYFALLSFVVKLVLQLGTLVPGLGTAVFGFRPIIIGFLHLVFLGFVSFYMLSLYVEEGVFHMRSAFTKGALFLFSAGIIAQELILMVQGVGLLAGSYHPVYYRMLWVVSILLTLASVAVAIAGIRKRQEEGSPATYEVA